MSLPNKKRQREQDLASPRSPSTSNPSSPTKNKKKSKYANAPSALVTNGYSPFHKASNEVATPNVASTSHSAPSSPLHKRRSSTFDGSSDSAAWIKGALKKVDSRIAESRAALPITSGKEAIVNAVRKHDTVVILGETGSGKTTQIPQFLFEAGFARRAPVQMIGVTQPRRVAATSLARRVAVEMGQPDPAMLPNLKGKARTQAGGLVGYSIRFEDRTTRNTRVKFMTDGMVLREMIGDVAAVPIGKAEETSTSSVVPSIALRSNLLLTYSVLIIDEAHERTLRTDQVLGLAKRIQRERKALQASWVARGRPSTEPEITQLKIIVMSATLDADRFANFFATPSTALAANTLIADLSALTSANQKQEVPILYVKGRQHEVDMFHTEEPAQEWTDAALRTVLQIHVSRPPGDILVFMTGQEEIDTLVRSLELYASELPAWAQAENKPLPMSLMIAPLYAALGPSASAKVFSPTPPHTRKVVLATNIAETSITIPGIVFVVDCGLAKEKVYTPGTAVETLQVQEISQSAARQRSGRAGRERAGECYRLYTQEAFKGLPLAGVPEIVRTDLAAAVLQLCAMGQDPYIFDWLDQPDQMGLRESVLQLIQLGALDIKTTAPLSNGASTDGPSAKPTAKLVLTPTGSKMAMLPVTPAYSRSLIAAHERGPTVARQVRDLIAILSSDRSILVDPSDPQKRDEANKAKSTFVHPSGDHATLLTVLYAYLDEVDKSRKMTKTRKEGKSTVDAKTVEKEGREMVKAWCSNHWVHEKAIKNVLHIRKQLRTICRQQKIVCDDDLAEKVRANGDSGAQGDSDDEDDDDDDYDDDADSSSSDESAVEGALDRNGLFVTRKTAIASTSSGSSGIDDSEENTSFIGLRQSLLEGRISNVGLKNPSAPNTYKRITSSSSSAGGTFKIHPSSTLHPSKMAREGGNKKMDSMLFEELVFTTQTFARTVSIIEPSWLQEVAQRK
ncbi:related to atp-dependent rna helicase [Melanopsichium pennsylvanicum]|uniref:RNA helicase n=2 Tax=Melanopsichium pennsylvanicum TaxID=63383 RepID=A0AAJ4XIF6_9BASI|nr:related to atp-dependent rna helicase [Melanopsichium pennsylvanicum 4]SNX81743.1 related to atp-dependent rna helicase [Melanopsichium pennsylvanicum]